MGEHLKTKKIPTPGDTILSPHHDVGTAPSKITQGLHNVPPPGKTAFDLQHERPVKKILEDKHQK